MAPKSNVAMKDLTKQPPNLPLYNLMIINQTSLEQQ